MYPQPDPAALFIYVTFFIIQVVVPILLLIVFIWLAMRVVSFLADTFSPDRGLRRRVQLHQHRLENLAAFMNVTSFATDVIMLLYGDPDGAFKVTLSGGVVGENVEVPAIFLGFANSVLWMLLKAKAPVEDTSMGFAITQDRSGKILEAKAPMEETSVDFSTTQDRGDKVGAWFETVGTWFQNIIYAKAGVITLVLFPIISVLAIPVGMFLFYLAFNRNRPP